MSPSDDYCAELQSNGLAARDGAPELHAAAGLLLTINGGSSSIRFAIFERGDPPVRLLSGKIERIGLSEAVLTINRPGSKEERVVPRASSHPAAAEVLGNVLRTELGTHSVIAIGHRIVHGGPRYTQPEKVTLELLEELHRLTSWDPTHLPSEIALIEAFARQYPAVPQYACFDTAFHRDMPRVAQMLAIPRRFEKAGVRRYGFHGLSYTFLMQQLERLAGPEVARGRVILAHLGNGASLAAVKDGRSVDTSMGFSPSAGIPMGTRSGNIDPGLVRFLSTTENLSADQFDDMVTRQSGLLGVSETSSDMRDLLAQEQLDVRSAEAIMLFCYEVKKWIGAFAAVLGGVDTLVFSGGIGEHVPTIRARICIGLHFLGIELDPKRNAAGDSIISAGDQCSIRIISTDEEQVIAKMVLNLFGVSDQ